MGQTASEHNDFDSAGDLLPPRIPRMSPQIRTNQKSIWNAIEWGIKEPTGAHVARNEFGSREFKADENEQKSPDRPNPIEKEDRNWEKIQNVSEDSVPLKNYIHREGLNDGDQFKEVDVCEYLDQPLEQTPATGRRIHILGVGPTGKFVAHALASLSERPLVSLLLNREDIIQRWNEEGQLIEVLHRKSSDVQAGFDVEPLLPVWGSKLPIWMLVVTTKPSHTIPLLLMLKPRLGPGSTICFLQNSMGVMEDVSSTVFPDTLSRPRYICGTTSHLLTPSARTFTTEHKRPGKIWLSLVPRPRFGLSQIASAPNKDDDRSGKKKLHEWTASSRKLMRNLTRSTHLQAKGLQYQDILEIQLERLAFNAIVEPLCVMFNCPCGDLLSNFAITQLIAGLLSEITTVIRSLPEFAESDSLRLDKFFSPRRIEYLIFQYAAASKLHIPDMLVNLRKGQPSEIEWLNGYILRRAEELGIACPMNQLIVQMVKAKEKMMLTNLKNYVSWEGT